jgi:hypothetical protein
MVRRDERYPFVGRYMLTSRFVAMNTSWVAGAIAGVLALGLAASSSASTISGSNVADVFSEQLEASLVPGGAYAVVSDEGIHAGGVGRA